MSKNVSNEIMGRIFIVGCARSGTTLLQRLLSAHPLVQSFPESHFFSSIQTTGWKGMLGIANRDTSKRFKEFLVECQQEDLIRQIPHKSLWARAHIKNFTATLDEITRRNNCKLWLEKTPLHLHYINLIQKHLPGAKFIHIIRRGEDVVASMYEVTQKYPDKWGGPRSVGMCIDRWNNDIAITQNYLKNKDHFIVSYEKLVESPKATLQGACNFLSIHYCDTMLNQRADTNNIVLGYEEWKNGVNEKINQRSGKKFNKNFTTEQQSYIKERLNSEQLDAIIASIV